MCRFSQRINRIPFLMWYGDRGRNDDHFGFSDQPFGNEIVANLIGLGDAGFALGIINASHELPMSTQSLAARVIAFGNKHWNRCGASIRVRIFVVSQKLTTISGFHAIILLLSALIRRKFADKPRKKPPRWDVSPRPIRSIFESSG